MLRLHRSNLLEVSKRATQVPDERPKIAVGRQRIGGHVSANIDDAFLRHSILCKTGNLSEERNPRKGGALTYLPNAQPGMRMLICVVAHVKVDEMLPMRSDRRPAPDRLIGHPFKAGIMEAGQYSRRVEQVPRRSPHLISRMRGDVG